jgi:hypothetical protein
MMLAMKTARLVPTRVWTALTAMLARRALPGVPAHRGGGPRDGDQVP